MIPKRPGATGTGWLTTDHEEIERRRQRALQEDFQIEAIDPAAGEWRLITQSERQYRIELRSLELNINSCTCPDFETSGLGTCKHIEALLLQQQPPSRPPVWIWLDRRVDETDAPHKQPQPTIRIHWPEETGGRSTLYQQLSPYFSESGVLLADALTGVAAVQQTVNEMSPTDRVQVHISHLISPWLAQLQRRQQRQLTRSNFLKDVARGKRNLNLLKLPLYEYQQQGALHLAFGGRAILADEIGLGKTVQAIAAAELLAQTLLVERVLVLSPASLKTEWEEQIEKFSSRSSLMIQGSRGERQRLYRQDHFFYLANYEQVLYDGEVIQQMLAPDLIILDEAQRINNWQSKTANAVKQLQSPFLFILTGTPLDHRIDEVYSIVQAVDPHLFGPLFRFNRDFYRLDARGRPKGVRNLDALYRRLKPIFLRRSKDEVEEELPERTVNNYFVKLAPEQSTRYDHYARQAAHIIQTARQRPLSTDETQQLQHQLTCMRMLCDTPYILDTDCRVAPKLDELKRLFGEIFLSPHSGSKPNKVILFSQWSQMLELIRHQAESMDIHYAHHSDSADRKQREVERFRQDTDCRLLLISDADSSNLSLQVADIVINVDLPWNPARLEQRITHARRKHRHHSLQVINLISENTIEHRMLHLLERKSGVPYHVSAHDDANGVTLPSNHKAMLEYLSELLEDRSITTHVAQPSTVRQTSEPLTQLQQEIEARAPGLGRKVIEVENGSGSKSIVAVIPSAQQTMIEPILTSGDRPVKMISPTTLRLLQQLAENGAITLNEPFRVLLPESNNRRQRIVEAQQQLTHSERPLKMAQLLFDGGFEQEALSPLTDALNRSITLLLQAEEVKRVTDSGLPAQHAAFAERFLRQPPRQCDHDLMTNGIALMEQIRLRLETLLLS